MKCFLFSKYTYFLNTYIFKKQGCEFASLMRTLSEFVWTKQQQKTGTKRRILSEHSLFFYKVLTLTADSCLKEIGRL
jgi:hypothetical protein